MIDLAREIFAAQTHRRTVDPRFLAKRVTPFAIQRPAAVVQPQHPSHDGQAQSASPNGDDAREIGEVAR